MSTQTAQQEVIYEPPKTFAERARPLFDRGIPVIPVAPNGKNATLKDWNTADFGWRDALAWDQEANVGCVAAAGFCYLDDDKGNLSEIVEKETGLPLKKLTYTVKTAKGYHYYFKTSEASMLVGHLRNHSAANFGFDFQNQEAGGAKFYVVGPGSIHPSGVVYRPLDEHQGITEIPDKLVEWLVANAEQKPVRVAVDGDGAKLHEDFDFNAWLEHYELTVNDEQDGWYGFDECPIAGYKHEGQNDISCALFYDGEGFGFKCHAAGCPGNEDGLNNLEAHLHEHGYEPYPGVVWAVPDPAETLKLVTEFGAEVVEPVAAQAVVGEAAPASEASEGEEEEGLKYPQLKFPYEAIPEGRLKNLVDKACEGGLSPGFVVPSLLALASALPLQDRVEGAMINLFMTLLAIVGTGKDTAIDRCGSVLGLKTEDAGWKQGCTVYTPSGERSVAMLIGSLPGTKDNPEITPGPRTHCVITYELDETLRKNKGETSGLFTTLQHFYDHKQKEFNDTKWRHKQIVDCRLSWLTALPVGDEEIDENIYRKAFGDASSHGFVSRMLFGFAEERVDRRKTRNWHVDEKDYTTVTRHEVDLGDGVVTTVERRTTLAEEIRNHKCKGFAPGVAELYETWAPKKDWTGRDVNLHVLKIAAVTAIVNGHEYIEKSDWDFAVTFMEWQGRIREMFASGKAMKTTQAEFNEIVIRAVQKLTKKAKDGTLSKREQKNVKVVKTESGTHTYVRWSQISADSKWWRHGVDVEKSVKALIRGRALAQFEDEEWWVRLLGQE